MDVSWNCKIVGKALAYVVLFDSSITLQRTASSGPDKVNDLRQTQATNIYRLEQSTKLGFTIHSRNSLQSNLTYTNTIGGQVECVVLCYFVLKGLWETCV